MLMMASQPAAQKKPTLKDWGPSYVARVDIERAIDRIHNSNLDRASPYWYSHPLPIGLRVCKGCKRRVPPTYVNSAEYCEDCFVGFLDDDKRRQWRADAKPTLPHLRIIAWAEYFGLPCTLVELLGAFVETYLAATRYSEAMIRAELLEMTGSEYREMPYGWGLIGFWWGVSHCCWRYLNPGEPYEPLDVEEYEPTIATTLQAAAAIDARLDTIRLAPHGTKALEREIEYFNEHGKLPPNVEDE